MVTDAELLRRYVEQKDEPAFTDLVQRHIGLVYAAALRRTNGRAHLAEEIAQTVFSDLARKAVALRGHPTLTGWLYRSTRYTAIDAARAEQRREKLAQSLATMSDETSSAEGPVDWEKLRPVIDEAMDRLSERDREIMLLRFFNGLTFGEVGAQLNLSENAARMRAERALEKLRHHLGQRGVASPTAALGLVLANSALAAAPAGLAPAVATAALANVPTGLAATFMSLLFMSKFTVPVFCTVLASGLTLGVWTMVPHRVSAAELAALRLENARLTEATRPGASPAALAAVAEEFSTQATAIGRAMKQRSAQPTAVSAASTSTAQPGAGLASKSAVTARGHSDHGLATAHDAALTFAWAGDISDPDVMARVITFDDKARARAEAILATMPESIRTEYPTVEAFFGMLLAASTLEAPPPGADMIARMMTEVELAPGRVAMRRVGTNVNVHEYQLTATGWKYVLPEAGVNGLPSLLNSETLAKLAKH